jgi:hypothetical protein
MAEEGAHWKAATTVDTAAASVEVSHGSRRSSSSGKKICGMPLLPAEPQRCVISSCGGATGSATASTLASSSRAAAPSSFLPPLSVVEVPLHRATVPAFEQPLLFNSASFGSSISKHAQAEYIKQGSPPTGIASAAAVNAAARTAYESPTYEGTNEPPQPTAAKGFRLRPRCNGLVSANFCTPSPSGRGRKRSSQCITGSIHPLAPVGSSASSQSSRIDGSSVDLSPHNPEALPSIDSIFKLRPLALKKDTLETTGLDFQGLTLQSPKNKGDTEHSLLPRASVPLSHAASPTSFTACSGFSKMVNSPADSSSFYRVRTGSFGSTGGGGGEHLGAAPSARADAPCMTSPKIVPLTVLTRPLDMKLAPSAYGSSGSARPPLQPSGPNTSILSLGDHWDPNGAPSNPYRATLSRRQLYASEACSPLKTHGSLDWHSIGSRKGSPGSAKLTPLPRSFLSPRSSKSGNTYSPRNKLVHDGLPRFPSPTDDLDFVSPMVSQRGSNTIISTRVTELPPTVELDVSFLSENESAFGGYSDESDREDAFSCKNSRIAGSLQKDSFIPFPKWANDSPASAAKEKNDHCKLRRVSEWSTEQDAPQVRSVMLPCTSRGSLECMLFNRSGDADEESLSDDDDFLLAVPSTIAEEKQRQVSSARGQRHSKLPRLDNRRGSMNSMASNSCTSLKGIDFAFSSSSLRGMDLVSSVASLRDMDTLTNSIGKDLPLYGRVSTGGVGMRRDNSVPSIGLTLDLAIHCDNEETLNTRDLITPPVMTAPACPPPLSPRFGSWKNLCCDHDIHSKMDRRMGDVLVTSSDKQSIIQAITVMAVQKPSDFSTRSP